MNVNAGEVYEETIAELENIINYANEIEITKSLVNYETKREQIIKKIYFIIKRIFDVFCAFIGIIALIPIATITKIGYLIIGDKKSIFYKQKRIGKKGKIIYIYKFRSMVYNADETLGELLKDPKYKEEWDKNQKLENDPRITKIGKILRKTSLDELPQFINVLNGDMSVIGPRPLVEGELDAHNGSHKIYESVRPGISGWWAANGRSNIDYDTRLELEYYYCKNCSIWLDIKCILKTIKIVVFRKGAR